MHLVKQQNLNKKIKENFNYNFDINKRGLYSISITATCRSGKQMGERGGEDLRVEIDGQSFREIPPDKNIQLYNIPASWNGTKLKGLKKTVVFILWLEKGNHKIAFIPDKGAKLENLEIKELGQNIRHSVFDINERAEDGDRRPWYTFVLVDLPLKHFSLEATIQKQLWDSDDIKIIVDGDVKRNIEDGKHIFWYIVGGVLGWIVYRLIGKKKRIKSEFDESLTKGIHYIELHADRMPILHNVGLDLGVEIDFRTRAKVVWSHTRLRKEPTTKSEAIIDRIDKTEQVVILKKAIKGERVSNETNNKLLSTNRWHKVEYKGKTGFIYSLALEIEKEDKETIQKIIIEKSKDFELDPEILLALAKCESEFFPYTVSFDEKRPEIAFGVMQISGDLLNDLKNYFDLEQNVQRGVGYFNDQYNKKYKDDQDRLRKSIAAYNAGPSHVKVNEPLELELHDPETQRIVRCVQNHLKKKTFKKILKSLAKVGIGLFLIFQLLLFCEAWLEPKNEIITYPGDNSANVIQTVRNTESDTQLLEFPRIVWDKDVEKLAFFNKEAKLVKIIPIERLDLDLIFSEFVNENSIYIADEVIEFPENVFYFLISTLGYCGASGNCTWGLYQLDIEKDKLELIDDGIFGSGISFYLSPDNKNLAIERSVHGGICNYGNYFDVIDLENFDRIEVKELMNQEKYWVNLIESLEWINNSEIKIKTEQFNCDDNEGPLKRVLFYDVRSGKVRILESKISKFQGAG